MINEGQEIDLENPIFTYYIDSRNKSKIRLDDEVHLIRRYFPSNITLWLVLSEQPSKIECVWKGKSLESSNNKVKEKLEKIFNWIETLPENEVRQNLRNHILEELLNEES